MPLIFPENQPAAELFYVCATQWRRDMGGARLGLDYQGVIAALQLMGETPGNRELFHDLQTIELGALGVDLDFSDISDLHIVHIEATD